MSSSPLSHSSGGDGVTVGITGEVSGSPSSHSGGQSVGGVPIGGVTVVGPTEFRINNCVEIRWNSKLPVGVGVGVGVIGPEENKNID